MCQSETFWCAEYGWLYMWKKKSCIYCRSTMRCIESRFQRRVMISYKTPCCCGIPMCIGLTYEYTYMHVYVCIYIFIYICTCKYIYIFIYTYIYLCIEWCFRRRVMMSYRTPCCCGIPICVDHRYKHSHPPSHTSALSRSSAPSRTTSLASSLPLPLLLSLSVADGPCCRYTCFVCGYMRHFCGHRGLFKCCRSCTMFDLLGLFCGYKWIFEVHSYDVYM